MQSRGNNSGFTLVEFLISFGIIVLIIGAIGVANRDLFSFNALFQEGLISQRDIENTLVNVVSEIRASTQSSTGTYPIEIATEDSFAFYSNVDSDTDRERVHYFLDGTDFMKSVVHPAGDPITYATSTASETLSVVLRNVVSSTTAPVFSYYDGTFAGTSSPLTIPLTIAVVRHIEIRLIIDKDPARLPPPITASSRTSIRNLKDNY